MENGKLWWEREDLCYRDGRLHFGGRDLETLASSSGTPTFVYYAARVSANLERLRAALDAERVAHDAFFAIKANRFAPLVTFLKLQGRCGIDACSPAELIYARQAGFEEAEISYTGTSVSETDLDCLQQHPGVHVNCDSISTIRRLGRRCPGRRIGIRINPELGAGYNEKLRYAGDKPTKFGIYRDRFDEALETARDARMRVETLHFHIGSGYQGDAVEVLDRVLERTGELLDAHPEIRTLNIGGGIGLRVAETDVPVDLASWAQVIARHAVRHGLRIQVEPGDYLVKDAGLLLARVNTAEDKAGTRFAGIDAGLGIENLVAYYRTPVIVAPLRRSAGAPLERVTIAGNINEAMDLLVEDLALPPLAEGDLLALLNVGGYGSAAASNHCMRGEFREYLMLDHGSAA
jgi:diaminopimelate decarboxylase